MINFRKKLFYFIDFLRGGKIKSDLLDIKLINENPNLEFNTSNLDNRLFRLLEHASRNVDFYKKCEIQGFALTSFPVINKNIIRDNIESFISKGTKKENLFRVVTSGSTGTPFSIYHNLRKKERNSADTIYFGNLAGYEIGLQLNYLKIWTQVNRKSKFNAWAENIIPIDVTHLSDENIENLLLSFQTNNGPKAFLGYASALESLCQFIEKKKLSKKIANVKSIIAMSEGLSDSAKQLLHKHFGIYPVSRYSNVENGIIAQQLPDGSNEFIVNWASYYIEILALDSNDQLPLGESGRIVVTDYFNYSMPMIRYDTGDIGVLDWNKTKDRKVLTKVEGRKMDLVFDTSGNLVSSFTITNNMWLYPEIKQYQFIQIGKTEYIFKLNLEGVFEREELLISEFKNYFGLDANIKVEYVDEIPLLNSGKRKKVMNLLS